MSNGNERKKGEIEDLIPEIDLCSPLQEKSGD
jgi:hypothetical protein